MGALTSAEAGSALATGWHSRRPDDDLAVVPFGAAGAGLTEAYADLAEVQVGLSSAAGVVAASGAVASAGTPTTAAETLLLEVDSSDTVLVGVAAPRTPTGTEPDAGDPTRHATSRPWGEAIRQALVGRAEVDTLVVDLGGCRARDGGAGLLGALGASADVPLDRGIVGLAGITTLDLTTPRDLLGRVGRLVVVVPADQVHRVLLGMQGVTSLHGAELREEGLPWDPADLLAADAALGRLATLAVPEFHDGPGLGACGGVASALVALGGVVVSGSDWLAGVADLRGTFGAADLIVTGTGAYDFAHRGGETVETVVALAAEAMRPVVAVAGFVTISAREMRAHGLEAAYPVHSGVPGETVDVTTDDLVRMGARVAGTWAG